MRDSFIFSCSTIKEIEVPPSDKNYLRSSLFEILRGSKSKSNSLLRQKNMTNEIKNRTEGTAMVDQLRI